MEGRGDGGKEKSHGGRKSRDRGDDHKHRVTLSSNREPTYYIGGGNGVGLISEALDSLRWRRLTDKQDEGFRLRWTEVKSQINYNTFKEGDQMVNHIPNCQLLTNKMGLLTSLQECDRVQEAVKKGRGPKIRAADFLPETYRLDDPKEKQLFFDTYKEGETWICKPTGCNQGKGIFLVRSLDDIRQTLAEHEATNEALKSGHKPTKSLKRIIQRYITKPLLLDGRKFDIRAYMLISSTVPYLVLYHKGYARLTMYEYDMNSDNLIAHLTNQFIQKKDPQYKDVKEDTAWSMDKFNDYINQNVAPEKGLEQDWVYNHLTKRMKEIMKFTFSSVKHRLQCKVGYFELYGLDFMVDEDMKVYLIEVNINPCLATNCEALHGVVPTVVREGIYISIECFDKSRRNRPLMPVQAIKTYEVIYDGSAKSSSLSRSQEGSPSRTTAGDSHAYNRRSRSLSPLKEPGGDGGGSHGTGQKKSGVLWGTSQSTMVSNNHHVSSFPPVLASPYGNSTNSNGSQFGGTAKKKAVERGKTASEPKQKPGASPASSDIKTPGAKAKPNKKLDNPNSPKVGQTKTKHETKSTDTSKTKSSTQELEREAVDTNNKAGDKVTADESRSVKTRALTPKNPKREQSSPQLAPKQTESASKTKGHTASRGS